MNEWNFENWGITGLFFPSLRIKAYIPGERINIWRGKVASGKYAVSNESRLFNAFEEVQNIDIPIYFFAGESDMTCCTSLQKEYFEMVEAPEKKPDRFLMNLYQRRNMGTIKTIVFDAFGTLFQFTKGSSARTIMKHITDLGIEVDEKAFLEEWKPFYTSHTVGYDTFMTEREIFTARNQMLYSRYNVDRDAGADADELLFEASKRVAFSEVQGALEEIKKHYKVFIGSNTDDDVLLSVMKKNHVSVDKIYTSENLRCYKPDVRFYKKILEDNDLLPDEFLFVGDTGNDDIIGPRTVGMKTAFVDRAGTGADYGQDYTIADLEELISVMT